MNVYCISESDTDKIQIKFRHRLDLPKSFDLLPINDGCCQDIDIYSMNIIFEAFVALVICRVNVGVSFLDFTSVFNYISIQQSFVYHKYVPDLNDRHKFVLPT